jgi:hypothetical protein
MSEGSVLTPGEWEALIFQAPDQVQRLVFKLAAFHGYVRAGEKCKECGADVLTREGVI